MTNPFKFGTIVSEDFFTNRQVECQKLSQIIASSNHVIMIAPRRFGKTSLVNKVVTQTKRPVLWLDLQLITNVSDFAIQLMKQLFKKYPFERLKFLISHFRIVPSLSIHPITNNVEIAFEPRVDSFVHLEDVLNLIEKLGEERARPIVVFDEFQELISLEKSLDKRLRSVIQFHKNINYLFLGSAESLMKQIFENKKSPFYHFGQLFTLDKIPYHDFYNFLITHFEVLSDNANEITEKILEFSNCHPYYTQQLAFHIWLTLEHGNYSDDIIETIVDYIILLHNNDFERLWNTFNNTDKRVLIEIAFEQTNLLSTSVSYKNGSSTSTIYSALKRLTEKGILIKTDKYEIDDPFFKNWIIKKRSTS
ncbi:MAG: ATP-binding protein [Bacteroidales bacterium]|jgi:AAA+ ATPase superfamily predicted ATPase|nr:ATP-binding protein [Bacteroidales bacterium]